MSNFIIQSVAPSFKESAKKEIASMIVALISMSILTTCIYYTVLPSILDAKQIETANFLLIISAIFIYILICIAITLYSTKEELKSQKANISINATEYNFEITLENFKYSIKLYNMIKENQLIIIVAFILNLTSVLILTLYGLENGTLSTSYELLFDKCISYICGILLCLIELSILFIFASNTPTDKYYLDTFLRSIKIGTEQPQLIPTTTPVPATK